MMGRTSVSGIRKIHLYLGNLFAPAIVFFAFTGILQTLGLHEAEDAASSQPPAWIASLASLHKDQHLPQPKARNAPTALDAMRGEQAHDAGHDAGHDKHSHGNDAGTAPGVTADEAPARLRQTLLKAFVVLMAGGLIVSVILGVFIACSNARTRPSALVMLVIGMLLPLVVILR